MTFASCFRLVVALLFGGSTEELVVGDTTDDDDIDSRLRRDCNGGCSSRSLTEMEGVSLS